MKVHFILPVTIRKRVSLLQTIEHINFDSLLATDRSKAVVFGVVPTKCFWSRCFVS